MMLIYLIRNKVNGKMYVGQTSQSLQKRWIGHCSSARRPIVPISFAIKKYGPDNFSIETLQECSSLEELSKAEISWIAHLKTQNSKIGYNLCAGGSGGIRNPSQRTRRRLSESHRGRKISSETRQKLSEISSKRKRHDMLKFAQKVAVYDGEGKLFRKCESYTHAARATGKGVRTVQRCCEYLCSTRDKKWFFLPDNMFGKRLPRKFMETGLFRGTNAGKRASNRILEPRSIPVHIEVNGSRFEYASMSEAARALNVHPMRIKRAMNPKSLESDFRVLR